MTDIQERKRELRRLIDELRIERKALLVEQRIYRRELNGLRDAE